jgi:hypothetical protein
MSSLICFYFPVMLSSVLDHLQGFFYRHQNEILNKYYMDGIQIVIIQNTFVLVLK